MEGAAILFAPVLCLRTVCFLCGGGGDACCSNCWASVCWACSAEHCAGCGALPADRAAADYEDSPRGSAASTGSGPPATSASTSSTDCEAPSGDEFFGKLDALWEQSSGYGELAPELSGRLHRLPLMSRCCVFDQPTCSWRFFGDLSTFQALASAMEWDLPAGVVVLHGGERACLLFRSGQDAEPLPPEEALGLLLAKRSAALCLVIMPSGRVDEGFDVSHLELRPATMDRRSQVRARNCLDKMLRALISKNDVAFWRPTGEA